MELGVLWRSLRQRWYLVLALGVLTVSATYLVHDRIGPTYQATGTMLVFPPSQTPGPGGDTTQGNPYLTLGGVNQARDVLVRRLTSKSVSDAFAEQFPGTTFEVVPDYTNSAPIILFTVDATTSGDAVAALHDLMSRVPIELDALQEGLNLLERERVTSVGLTRDERPTPTHKAQLRGSILVAAVLIGAGLLLIALADGILDGRQRGRPSTSAPLPTVKRAERQSRERTRPTAAKSGRGPPTGPPPGPSSGPSSGPSPGKAPNKTPGKAPMKSARERGRGRSAAPAEVATRSRERRPPAMSRGDAK